MSPATQQLFIRINRLGISFKSPDTPTEKRWLSCVVLFLIVFWGCDGEPNPVVQQQDDSLPNNRVTIHDAGDVMAGESITHRFLFRNPLSSPIKIDAESDIQESCGCLKVQLIRQVLAVGEETPILVEVGTDTKRGRISETVLTSWKSHDSEALDHRFSIRANIHSALICTPAELTFNREEVAHGVSKQVICRSDLALDWNSLRISNNSTGIELRDSEVTETGYRFTIRCPAMDSGQAQSGELHLAVNPARKSGSDPTSYTNRVPVFWLSPHKLQVSPPLITLQPHAAEWRAWCIITGSVIKAGVTIEAVEFEGCKLDFQAQKIGQAATRIDFRLPRHPPHLTAEELTLRLSDGNSKIVKVTCPPVPASQGRSG
ncbi:MAG: DUF1573 domain-containing protein [Pirellulaceae bacterium]|nr:DUF1573 domain-containing protein [Pirellulaceae bacterium]